MAIGLIGKKSGMTRIFNEEGESVPVTVIEAEPNRVTQVKSLDSDGYAAIQVTTGERRRSRVTKAMAGHFAKAHAGSGRGLWEFRVDEVGEVELGGELSVEQFEAGQIVDVQGT
jgi:large subunit ribosomal protein L3